MRYSILFTFLIYVISCVPPNPNKDNSIDIDYSLEEQRQIRDWQDARSVVELIEALNNKDANIRYLACNALASLQDSASIVPLGNLLMTDPSEDVRFQAAYALGQTFNRNAERVLIESFVHQDTSDINSLVRKAILEAVGKTGGERSLEDIASVTTYSNQEDQLLMGQALAIYRFALRGINSQTGTDKMISFVIDKDVSEEARVMAANYLHRTRGIDLSEHVVPLITVLEEDRDPKIRMTVATGLGRTGIDSVRTVLLNSLSSEGDYRVQVNILRALSSFGYLTYRDSIIVLLNSPNPHVARVASEVILNNADVSDRRPLLELARQSSVPSVKANLYAATLKLTPVNFINTRFSIRNELIAAFESAGGPYDQVKYLQALAFDPGNFESIQKLALESDDPVLQTAGVSVLSNLMTTDRFNQWYPTPVTISAARQEILNALIKIMDSGNAGAIAVAAGMIRDEDYGFEDLTLIRLPMRQALRNLDLPDELETEIELEKTLAYLNNEEYTYERDDYNRGINWLLLANMSDTTVVTISTSKGNIRLKLLYKEAPSSVSNFLQLVNDKYYNGKTFHRVIPNFVIQGGCPIGDGYGSLDYTIRSELGPSYYDKSGKLGMASAGKDTEGVQWFITHCPTPHLDGSYTIFGNVLEGMNIVHQIEVGDVIQDITVSY